MIPRITRSKSFDAVEIENHPAVTFGFAERSRSSRPLFCLLVSTNQESGSSENSGLDPKPALSSTPGWLQKERNTSAKRSFEETAEEDVVDISEAYKKQRSKDWLEIKAASSSMSASFRAPQKQDRETSSSMSMCVGTTGCSWLCGLCVASVLLCECGWACTGAT